MIRPYGIDGFHGGKSLDTLNALIDRREICVNDLILSELVPSIRVSKEKELEDLLYLLPRIPMQIDWSGIASMQTEKLKHGINKIGLPDVIIAQNAMQNGVQLLSLDKHFELMAKVVLLLLYRSV